MDGWMDVDRWMFLCLDGWMDGWMDGWIGESVCVLYIKPFFPPVDIQHNQCPCRFFPLLIRDIQALWSQNHDTEILHCDAVNRVVDTRQ